MSITQAPSVTWHARPSLAVFVAHPFGLTLGAPTQDATHQAVVRAALAEAQHEHPAGTIVPTKFQWPDQLRARQLRKQAR